jgi:hypothetical protein
MISRQLIGFYSCWTSGGGDDDSQIASTETYRSEVRFVLNQLYKFLTYISHSHITVICIGAGMHGLANDITDTSAAGNFPDVQLFDGAGRLVGRNGGKNEHPHVDAGGFKEVTISHEKNMDGVGAEYSQLPKPHRSFKQLLGRNADFALLVALAASGNDAICINWVSVAWPSGEHWGFLGDLGTMCNADWYYSDTLTANWDSESTEAPVLLNRSSNCLWLDGDGSNGLRLQGLGIHLLDFSSSKDSDNDGRAKQYHANPETMRSNALRFKMYEDMHAKTEIPIFWPKLAYNSDNSDADLKAVTNNAGKCQASDVDLPTGTFLWSWKNETPLTALHLSSPQHFQTAPSLSCTTPSSRAPSNSTRQPNFAAVTTPKVLISCLWSEASSAIWIRSRLGHFARSQSFTVALMLTSLRPSPLGCRSINGHQIPEKSYTKEVKWGSSK